MSSRRSTRYRNPPTAASYAWAVSRSEQKKIDRNSMSAQLSIENQQERRARGRRHESFRKLFSAHSKNALKAFVRKHLAVVHKKNKGDHKKSKCAPTIDTTLSQGSDTPPPPSPPLTTLPPPPKDIPLNDYNSLDSANAAEGDDLSFSDDGVNLWDLASTQNTEEIDYLLIQIMNNSSMYIRRMEDSIKGKEEISPPQKMDSILSISPDYEDDSGEEKYLPKQETKATDVTVDSCLARHDEEGKVDALFDFARGLEELSVFSNVDTTKYNEPSDDEEDSIPDVFMLDQTATSLNVAEQTNMKNEDVDSALAWSALSFFLGSPAPASVARKSSRKDSAKLWDLDVGAVGEEIPDLPTSEDASECVGSQRLQAQAQEVEEEGILDPPGMFRVSSFLRAKEGSPRIDQNDTFTTASLTSSDDTSLNRGMFDFETESALGSPGNEEEDSIPDVFMLGQTATSLNVAEQTSMKNEDVDSALAWSALSFFLGSPAPASLTRKSSRKDSAKLWDFYVGAAGEDIPDIPASEDALVFVTY